MQIKQAGVCTEEFIDYIKDSTARHEQQKECIGIQCLSQRYEAIGFSFPCSFLLVYFLGVLVGVQTSHSPNTGKNTLSWSLGQDTWEVLWEMDGARKPVVFANP